MAPTPPGEQEPTPLHYPAFLPYEGGTPHPPRTYPVHPGPPAPHLPCATCQVGNHPACLGDACTCTGMVCAPRRRNADA